jgi:hypothetical protein
MSTATPTYTTKSILASLGYPDPMAAARQQGRMILLGRRTHYQAEIRQLEKKWGRTLAEMRVGYEAPGNEDFAADDDYVQWQWLADAVEAIDAQLAVLAEP